MSMAVLLLDFMKYERISMVIASSSCGTFLCKPMIGLFALAFVVFSAYLLDTRYSPVAFECFCMHCASIVLISVF